MHTLFLTTALDLIELSSSYDSDSANFTVICSISEISGAISPTWTKDGTQLSNDRFDHISTNGVLTTTLHIKNNEIVGTSEVECCFRLTDHAMSQCNSTNIIHQTDQITATMTSAERYKSTTAAGSETEEMESTFTVDTTSMYVT